MLRKKEARHTLTCFGSNPRVVAPVSDINVLICDVEATERRKASVGTLEVGHRLAWWWLDALGQVGDAGISCNVRQRCCDEGGGKFDHGCDSRVRVIEDYVWKTIGGVEWALIHLFVVSVSNLRLAPDSLLDAQ
jgi:hypothetical protein